MQEQIEMFDIPDYHYYELPRYSRLIKAFVVPYSKESAWSGAWYKNEAEAARFVSQLKSRLENV